MVAPALPTHPRPTTGPGSGSAPPAVVRRRRDGLEPVASVDFVGFVAVHLVALLGGLAVGCPPGAVAVGVASYGVRVWAAGAGVHRYFGHRAFRLGRGGQFVMAVLGTLAVPKGVLWWVGHHRARHQEPAPPATGGAAAGDGARPQARGLGYRHVGWLFDQHAQPLDRARVADWYPWPELRWLQRHRLAVNVAFGAALWLTAGPAAFVWGWAVASVAVWHALLAPGALDPGHRRNHRLLAALLLGDGWHHNHRQEPASAHHGSGWRQPDPVWWSLLVLEGTGLAWGLRDAMPRRPRAGARERVEPAGL